jgi:hypothetical protein
MTGHLCAAFAPTIFALLATAPVIAAAPAVSLYGLELGAPFVLPECPLSEQTDMCWSASFVPKTRAEAVLPPGPGEMREKLVYFAAGGAPRISSARYFTVKIADRALQEIAITTKGLSVQEDAFKQLSDKFGKPELFNVAHLQNGFGAKFDRIEAQWRAGTMTIRFFGMLDKVDIGLIEASTAAATKDRQRSRVVEPKL